MGQRSQLYKNKQNSDIVEIYCYGTLEVMPRAKAIKEYITAIACSEGSEQSRYSKILSELLTGKKVCSDSDEYVVNNSFVRGTL